MKHVSLLFAVVLALTGCEKGLHIQSPAKDPVAVFDDCWRAIDRNYALFPVKQIDWDSVYNVFRPGINATTTNAKLFQTLSDMLQILKDGHVALFTPADTFNYIGFYSGYAANFNWSNVQKTYLRNDFQVTGPLIYKLVNEVAYVYYGSFFGTLSESNLDTLFNAVANSKGMILDLRNNTGGSVDNASRFFARFVQNRLLVKYEMRKMGPGHTDFTTPQPFYISPKAPGYDKKIIVLTNRRCFSACNDFVLYMSSLTHAQQLGDTTGGGGAIPMDYLLVNGWKLQYSSSITFSPKNETVENGIAPDILMTFGPLYEPLGKDPFIEKAYQLLQ